MRFFISKMQFSSCNCFKQSLCFSCQQYQGFWPYYRWVAGSGGWNTTNQHSPEHAHVVPLSRVQGLILTPQLIPYCAKLCPTVEKQFPLFQVKAEACLGKFPVVPFSTVPTSAVV